LKPGRFGSILAMAAMLASCSGGGGGSVGGGGGGGSTPTPTPTGVAGCSLRERQDWAFAQLNEWYLFPETLPASLNPAPYSSVEAYIDALTATARAQRRDRFFTYITSIAQENAFYDSGASAGFGVRFSYDEGARRVFISEAFEGAPALAAGIDRGTELLAVGTTASNMQTVSALMAAGGAQAVSDALGPTTVGTSRRLRVTGPAPTGEREINVTKTEFALTPISSRYGAQIINDGARRVGYVNLRTFIDTADPALRSAFANFRSQGITDVIVDLRYNGGGLVSIADLFSNLLGGARTTSDVMSYTTYRPSKSANSRTTLFAPQAQSIVPARVAFIGTGGTASASELVINAQIPYLRANAALIGSNTYGKPVGQIAIDRAACDDRLRVIAFAIENKDHQGSYFDGLATKVEASCRAGDDVTRPLGDPAEASTRAALDFLAGRACTAISGSGEGGISTMSLSGRRELLQPERPSTPQREVPGLY
jgi:carboxyl-terminal processing protease